MSKSSIDRLTSSRPSAPYVPSRPETEEEKAARLETEKQNQKLRERQDMFQANDQIEQQAAMKRDADPQISGYMDDDAEMARAMQMSLNDLGLTPSEVAE